MLMTPKETVLKACRFETPNRIPRFDNFWEYPDTWREALGPMERLSDVTIWIPNEGTYPTRARILKREGNSTFSVDDWGRTLRTRDGAYFFEVVDVPVPAGTDIDSVEFDPPNLDSRYQTGHINLGEAAFPQDATNQRTCVFGKTGGPYLRTTFIRGEAQFLMDMAGDPVLARELADKMGCHLAAVGCEEMRRWKLYDTGIWIYDDMAYNDGPMFGPKTFEKILLPAYRFMIRSFKDAGAKYVFLHSDGNILPILEMLVDAGIEGINPVEKRAGMEMTSIRERFPELVLTGGMDNTDSLVNGPVERIKAEAREIIDLGRHGGVVIGTHSISPEIPLENFLAYHETCLTHGLFQD